MNMSFTQKNLEVARWSPLSVLAVGSLVLAQLVLACFPWLFDAGVVERLTVLFIYGIMALMWNALAGYAGLVSVGHQMFFGLGAYGAIRLADAGLGAYPSMVLAAALVGVLAIPLSLFMLKLKEGEFAIGMWVLASLTHMLVNLDTLVQGETGTSLIALQQHAPQDRLNITYWMALGSMSVLAWAVYGLLRGRVGTAAQAIRDNEEAAASIGVRVVNTKRLIFVLSALGCAVAGALWLATAITFQPKTYFSVQWTAYMIFMVLVGGIGTYEGPILGAIIFFVVETYFGDQGVLYLIGLGFVAVLFALMLPKGIWGYVEQRYGIRVLPVGYRLEISRVAR